MIGRLILLLLTSCSLAFLAYFELMMLRELRWATGALSDKLTVAFALPECR